MKKAISLLLVLVMAVSLFAFPVAAANPKCSKCGKNTTYLRPSSGTTTKYVTSCENDDYSHPHTVYTDWYVYGCNDSSCQYETWILIREREVCLYD